MKDSVKEKIQQAIKHLEDIGGLNNPGMKKVIVNLKKTLEDDVKSKK
jgi:hypothetical protein